MTMSRSVPGDSPLEHRYEDLFNGIGDAVLVADMQGRFMDVNETACSSLGYSREELLRLSIADIDAPEAARLVEERMRELRETGKGFFESVHRRKDGVCFPVEIHCRLTEFEGRPAVLAIARDISKRKKVEDALSESETRLVLAAEGTGMGIWQWDIPRDRRAFDEQVCRLLGIDHSSFAGTAEEFFRALHPEDRPKVQAALKRTVESGAPYEVQYRAVWSDGTTHHVMARGTLTHDEKGQPLRLLGLAWDVTERVLASEALRRAKEYAEQLVETANAMVVGLDVEGNIMMFNEAAERITGYKREELSGRNWFEVLVPRERYPEVWTVFEKLPTGKLPENFENPILTKAGRERIISWRNGILREGDRILGSVSYGIDITEQRAAMLALSRSERVLSATQRVAHIGSWEYDVVGKSSILSKEMYRLLGLDPSAPAPSREEQLGFVHPEDRPRLAEARRRAAEEGRDYEEQVRLLRPSGETGWLRTTGHAEKGPDGRVVRVYGTAQDVTAQVLVQESLRSSEARYRKLAEALSDYAYSCLSRENGPYRIDWVGGSFQRVAERPESELLRQGCWLPWVHPDDRARVAAVLARLRVGETADCEYRLLRADGAERLLHDRMLCVAESGDETALRLYGAVRDVTETRKLEKEVLGLQKIESLGTLAGGIAHDFNNMLTGIMGNIAFAMAELPKGEIREMLAEAESSARSAQSLTQQLLTFARGGKPVRKPFALKPMLIEAANFAVRGSNCVCSYELAPEVWAVDGDQGQLRQAVHNLILNAVQASPRGGEIVVSAGNAEIGGSSGLPLEAGRYVRVKVRDAGTGIPPEHLERIFDPYFSTKEQGRGLGLSMVISVVRNHGGHVSVASQLGSGTEFTLHLPAAAAPLDEEGSAAELPRGYGRVLVMEDDLAVGRVASRMLIRLGYEPALSLHGEEALAALETARATNRPFRAVVMDLVIPGKMGGKEAIARLRAVDRDIKVVVASGYSGDAVLADYKDYGFDAALSKPFKIETLAAILQKLLGPLG
ncbi:MAG: PAS domain S-box protein [Elusimicrobiota bacterium]|jgi:PAS domain S-box-containing protein